MLKGNLNKILFVVTYCYLLGIVLVLVSQNKLYLPFVSDSLNHNNSKKHSLSEADSRFIDYMKRALRKIDRTKEQPAPTTTSESSPTTLPTDRYTPIAPITQLPTQTSPPTPFIPPPPPTVNPPPPTNPATTNPAATNPAPTQSNQSSYSLIGLFEAGNNSVGLFELNGVVSRIAQGQPIGASGWVLESVTADQAVIAKGQEKRILTIGQKL